MDSHDFSKILRNWRVKPAEREIGSELPGSPERTTFRKAIADTTDQVWVLEEIADDTYSRKLAIAGTLESLKDEGLEPLYPYERNTLGQFITCYSGHLCMLRPHIEGIALDRDTWLNEGWRADAMACFLVELKKHAAPSALSEKGMKFSILQYIQERTTALKRHRPEIAKGLDPVFQGLENNLFPIIGNLPDGFCHGDFHPLNIIWGEDSIRSVIDWEFSGLKPEAYDAALLIGCIGFDDPDALIGEFTRTFVLKLHQAQVFSAESWNSFIDLVIAIRYCWLAEWMRTNDGSARDLEILYMNLLTTQRSYILEQWNLA